MTGAKVDTGIAVVNMPPPLEQTSRRHIAIRCGLPRGYAAAVERHQPADAIETQLLALCS